MDLILRLLKFFYTKPMVEWQSAAKLDSQLPVAWVNDSQPSPEPLQDGKTMIFGGWMNPKTSITPSFTKYILVCIWCLVSLSVTAIYTPQEINRRLDENLKDKPPLRNGPLIGKNKPTSLCIRKVHSTTAISVSQQLNTWDGNKMAWMTGKILK